MKNAVRAVLAATFLLLGVTPPAAPQGNGRLVALRGEIRVEPPEGSLLGRPAGLSVKEATVAEALTLLSTAANVSVAFSPNSLPEGLKVDCGCQEASLAEALDRILTGTEFGYVELGDQIVIVKRAQRETIESAKRPPARLASATLPLPLGIGRSLALVESVSAAYAAAPQEPVILGTVVDARSGTPISGAQVVVVGTQIGTLTNEAGRFRIAGLTAATVELDVIMMGYRTVRQTVQVGATDVRIELTQTAVDLDAIVVTGTAGNQQRRAQPAVVSAINAADILAKVPVLGVTGLLYGRVPGVSITTASGSTGASSWISIRGRASLNLSNDPLVFVDGVRISSGDRAAASSVGGQAIDGLSDLNPDDIESIEIVKGPAAATLYGADASAGVIQILTKRGGATGSRLVQTLTTEYHDIDPNFTPDDNYYRCRAADVAPTSVVALCKGKAVGDVVTDNPLLRENAFRSGRARVLNYSATGSGQDFGYFASFGIDDEVGTLRSNSLLRRTGRVNFRWTAHPNVTVDAGIGVARSDVQLAMGDQSSYGYLIGTGFASPRTVREAADGTLTGGWLQSGMSVQSISAILNENVSTRLTPSATLRFQPVPWFTNDLTVGADYLRQNATSFYPKNSLNWYSVQLNTGFVNTQAVETVRYSLSYTGNVRRQFGIDRQYSMDLSFGSQFINNVSSYVAAGGTGLVTNAANAVSQTSADRTGTDGFGQSKQLGIFGQVMLGFGDRLYLKFAERVDRHSAFARNAQTFLLPSVGLSYVVSEEPRVRGMLPSLISTLKVRLAYGETGRAPGSTAALQTYARAPYLTDAGVLVAGGVSPGNPGNPDLKPERGTELEGGFDVGLFDDRLGVELTYFNKTSKDLIVTNPLPVSAGFSSSPAANIGEMTNTGFELTARANLLHQANLVWDVGVSMNTLDNKIVSIENVNPINDRRCFKPGVEIAAWCLNRIQSVDTVTGIITVSDTAEYLGGQMPKREASFNTTITVYKNFRLYAQADGKFDYRVYNLGASYRDRLLGGSSNSRKGVLTREELGLSAYDWYRIHPNGVRTQSGATAGIIMADEDYYQDASFVRLREVSFTWTLPSSLSERVRLADGASLSVGGQNLALWTEYDGYDPEVLGTVYNTLFRSDVFTVPPPRRFFARVRVQF